MRSEEQTSKNKAQEGGDAAVPEVRGHDGQVRRVHWKDMAMPQQAVQVADDGKIRRRRNERHRT